MEGDGQGSPIIVSTLYNSVTVAVEPNLCLKTKKHRSSAKSSTKFTSNAYTNTNYSEKGNIYPSNTSYITNTHPVNNVRSNVRSILTPTQQKRCMLTMSKDTRDFAQTLRKYPLAKCQTNPRDLIQEILKRRENKNAKRKPKSSKRSLRKTNQETFKSKCLSGTITNHSRKLKTIAESVNSNSQDSEISSANELVNSMYDYLKIKPNLNGTDVRYFSGIKKVCDRLKDVTLPRPQICPSMQNRWNDHIKCHTQINKSYKQSACFYPHHLPCRCKNFIRDSEFEQEKAGTPIDPKLNNDINILQSAIKKWTDSIIKKKAPKKELAEMQLIGKLAEALNNLSTGSLFVPQAKNEIIKYLNALSIVHHNVNDNLNQLADNLLDNLMNENKTYKEKISKLTKNLPLTKINNENTAIDETNALGLDPYSKLKLCLIDFLNQFPIESKDEKYETLKNIVETFWNNIQELDQNAENIKEKDIGICNHYGRNNYLPLILRWVKSIPEFDLNMHDNVIHVVTLANNLEKIGLSDNDKGNNETAKQEVLKWLQNMFSVNNISCTISMQEILTRNLLSMFDSPSQVHTSFQKEDSIYNEIFKDINKELDAQLTQDMINILVTQLNSIKEQSDGTITVFQLSKELKKWYDYLAANFDIHLNDKDKKRLEDITLPLIKTLSKQRKRWSPKKSQSLKETISLDKIDNSMLKNDTDNTQRELENILNEIETQIFHNVSSNNLNDIKVVYEKIIKLLQSKLNLPIDKIEALAKNILLKINRAQENAYGFSKESSIRSNTQNYINTPLEKQVRSKNQRILNEKNDVFDKMSQKPSEIMGNKSESNKHHADELRNTSMQTIYLDDERSHNDSSNQKNTVKEQDCGNNNKYQNEKSQDIRKRESLNTNNYNNDTSSPHNFTNSMNDSREDLGTLFHKLKENYDTSDKDKHNKTSLDNWRELQNSQPKSFGGDPIKNYEPNRNSINLSLNNLNIASFDNIITSTPHHASDQRFQDLGIRSPSYERDIRKVPLCESNKEIELNQLNSKIKEWLKLLKLKLNEDDEKKVITSIASDIIHRDKFVRTSSKTASDLEEIEYLKYLIFKVFNNHIESQKMNNILSRVSKLYETIEKNVTSKNNEMIKENNEFHGLITSFLKWINSLGERKLNNFIDNEYTKQELIKSIEKFKGNRVQESLKNEIKKILTNHLNNINTERGRNEVKTIESEKDLENSLLEIGSLSNNISTFVKELIKIVLRYSSPENKNFMQQSLEKDILRLLKMLSTIPSYEFNMLANGQLALSAVVKTAIEQSLKADRNVQQPVIEGSDSLLYKILNKWCESLPIYVKDIGTDKNNCINLLCCKLFEKIKSLNQNHNLFDNNGFNDDVLNDEIKLLLNDLSIANENTEDLFNYIKLLISQLKDNIQNIQEELQIGVYKQNLLHSISQKLPDIEASSKDDLVPFEILKNNLANAFINLKFYAPDENMKKNYKEKLINEINKFCDLYLKRFPASPLETKQLHSNILDALENVPKPIQSKSEVQIITVINNWLDEISKENNNFTIFEKDNVLSVLKDRLHTLNNEYKLSIWNNYDELRKTIFNFLENYSLKQNKPLDTQYWTDRLINSLKILHPFGKSHSSIATSVSMHTIPAAETTIENKGRKSDSHTKGDQKETSNQTNHIIITNTPSIQAADVLTAEDRDLLARIRDRYSVPQIFKNIEYEYPSADTKLKTISVQNQNDGDNSGSGQEVSPNIFVREYFWDSNGSKQSSQINKTRNLSNTPDSELTLEKKRNISLEAHTITNVGSENFSGNTVSKLVDGTIQNSINEPFLNYDRLSESSQKILPANLNKTSLEQTVSIQEKNKSPDNYNASIANKQATKSREKVKGIEIIDSNKPTQLKCLQENKNVIATNSYERGSNEAIKTYRDQGQQNERQCLNDLIKNQCHKCRCRCPKRFTLKSESLHQGEEYKFCFCRDGMPKKCKIKTHAMKKHYPELRNCAQCFGSYCPFPSCMYFKEDI